MNQAFQQQQRKLQQEAFLKSQALLTSLEVKPEEKIKGKMYLHLYHGRDRPDEVLEDWGFSGPTFGPLGAVSITYNTTICITDESGETTGPMLHRDDPMYFSDDLTYYNGKYYGDYSLFVAD